MNNRRLLILLLVLGSVFLLSTLWRGKKSGSFDPVIIAVDTARVDRISMTSALPIPETFEIYRTPEGWEAAKGDLQIPVTPAAMANVLRPMNHLMAQRIATSSPDRYPDYEMTDEQATHVKVFQGKKVVAEVWLGGFKFDQVSRTASSYVRKANTPDVFIVDGFAGMGLKSRFDNFRDKKLMQVQADDLSKIEWRDGGARKEVIQKEEGIWHYAGMEAVDSAAFSAYLEGLVLAQGAEFSHRTHTEGLNAVESITLYGNNMLDPVVLRAFHDPDSEGSVLIHSSYNSTALFTSDSIGLYKRIFLDLRQFWPHGQ